MKTFADARAAASAGEWLPIGTVLFVPSAEIVGIACRYPFAVTKSAGFFATITKGDPLTLVNGLGVSEDHIIEAVSLANRNWFEVRDEWKGIFDDRR